MPVSDLIRLGSAKLTPQQIADMALQEDQAARALARYRTDHPAIAAHWAERDALCKLLNP